MEYRNEIKYIVKNSDLDILNYRLKNIMPLDSYIKENNSYNVRSIYFDDIYNTYYYENENGINERLKIRIRIYDKSDKVIKLEIKSKKNGMTKKEACPITKELCEKLMKKENLLLTECDNKVLYKVYLEQQLHVLRPKIIVEYDRTVYAKEPGNVRISFDRNIRASKYIERFFMDSIYPIPILEEGNHVLEVKYDELLPEYIKETLELNTLNATAFSKYYLSRLQFKEEVL